MENNEIVEQIEIKKDTVDEILKEWRIEQYKAINKNLLKVLAPLPAVLIGKFIVDNFDNSTETLNKVNRSRSLSKREQGIN